jgi:hypothetical protein
MIDKLLRVAIGVFLTGALVLFGMAWGRYASAGTSFDSTSVLTMTVLAGAILVHPLSGILRTRPRARRR